MSHYDIGDEVYWHDPDDDQLSGYYKITKVSDGEVTIYTLNDGTEVFEFELE